VDVVVLAAVDSVVVEVLAVECQAAVVPQVAGNFIYYLDH
jgi:hypothetical protein